MLLGIMLYFLLVPKCNNPCLFTDKSNRPYHSFNLLIGPLKWKEPVVCVAWEEEEGREMDQGLRTPAGGLEKR